MPENTPFVQHVQHLCGNLCSTKLLIHKACAACAAKPAYFPHVRVRMREWKKCIAFRKYMVLHMLHMLHIPSKSMTYEKSDAAHVPAHAAQHKRTIHCTPENAAQMQQVVKNWPELHALVKSLQDQNLFPGLRNMQITIFGSAEHCAKGLGALLPENASKPD